MCIIKRVFFCISFITRLHAMHDETYATLRDMPTEDLVALFEKSVDAHDDNDEKEWTFIEHIPFEQISIKPLSEKQSLQKYRACDKGTLFFYDKDLISSVFNGFAEQEKKHGIRCLLRYEPNVIVKQDKPCAVFVIHGTFGEKTEGYFDYNNEQFKNFVKYAATKAEAEGRHYDIYSICWSGENNDPARYRAGIELGVLWNMLQDSYEFFDVIAFSHGCNVALVAANILDGFKIRECIALAPPVLEDNGWFYAPHNIIYFFPFISWDDMVAPLGRFWSSSYNTKCTQWKNVCQKSLVKDPYDKNGRLYKHPCEKTGKVINIHYTHDNEHPSHSQLPFYIAALLPELMGKIYTDFTYHTCIRNLSINLVNPVFCEKHKVDPLNVSLFPQNELEELDYAQKLRLETLYESARHEQDHEMVYNKPKNAPNTLIQAFCNKVIKIFK